MVTSMGEATTACQGTEDDRGAYRCTMTGTHAGPLMGVEPTGKDVRFAGMGVARFEEGQVAEAWSLVDVAGVMQQLDAGPG